MSKETIVNQDLVDPEILEMDKVYEPHQIEARWYAFWEENHFFSPQEASAEVSAAETKQAVGMTSTASHSSYCIMIPPPNVTGSLHMGHAFQQTLMDVLIRYHRMRGDKTLWQVGTDHAGIATQMVVERKLLLQNKDRHTLGREAFVEEVWRWKAESAGNITQQLRRMGASVDWQRERFTLDENFSEAVQTAFIRLYEEGLIYRGKRLVNWDPILKTAVSDLEVESIEEKGKLWYLRYPLQHAGLGKNSEPQALDYLVVATTRPETMLGDVAVAVHPEDPRYQTLIGTMVILPLSDRAIPIIGDFEVDPEFGTGCVKITPAHDFNDYAMSERHHLPKINIFTPEAKLNEAVPAGYRGLDRFEARKKILKDLEHLDLIEKIEPHTLNIPRGDRSGAVLEPLLTDQWFLKVESLAIPAIKAVEQGEIRFVPENWSKTYFEWMRNIQDWCISRQLWWGHRIPAWYDEEQNLYVGASEAEVRAKHHLADATILWQDPDVLDTWFSSALWPFATLGWPKDTSDYRSFYPTQVLITGFDIIFFWVARMIMFGLKFTQKIPFHEVYIHGLIQDQNGQKMSKTKGNVLDPLDLVDGIDLESLVQKRTYGLMQPQLAEQIEKQTRSQFPAGIPAFGTDALRFTFAALATPGRFVRFDLKRIEGYRHFCNKIWNAARYVLLNLSSVPERDLTALSFQKAFQDFSACHSALSLPDRWILSRWQKTKQVVAQQLVVYRFDLAAQALYEFTWNEYCDWYLEFSKPALQSAHSTVNPSRGTQVTLVKVLEEMLRVLHPFMPYITEEVWQRLKPLTAKTGATVMREPYPESADQLLDEEAETEAQWVQAFILGLRNIRGEMNISPGKPLRVLLYAGSAPDRTRVEKHKTLLVSLAKIESIAWLSQETEKPLASVALLETLEILVPLAGLVDPKAEVIRLEKELDKIEKELKKLEAQCSNPQFIQNAPAEVVTQIQARARELTEQQAKHTQQLQILKLS